VISHLHLRVLWTTVAGGADLLPPAPPAPIIAIFFGIVFSSFPFVVEHVQSVLAGRDHIQAARPAQVGECKVDTAAGPDAGRPVRDDLFAERLPAMALLSRAEP
jgi:hypothetical protein